jgi:hypothetical protein
VRHCALGAAGATLVPTGQPCAGTARLQALDITICATGNLAQVSY